MAAPNGKQAFKEGQLFLRSGDESRPMQGKDDLADTSTNGLKSICREYLSILPALVVIDDVDSVELNEQKRIMEVATQLAPSGSRFLLTTRVNLTYPRRLLVVYYGLRGLSLMVLPFLSFNTTSLAVFAVFYGLDWIATVPPTVKLANQAFGEQAGPIVFGWIQTGHQLGAAVAAFGTGVVRERTGTYLPSFVTAGALGVIAAGVLILSLRGSRPAAAGRGI